MKFHEFWQIVSSDLQSSDPAQREFPLTDVTRAVAECLWRRGIVGSRPSGRALDVGTGSGVHAFLMSLLGYAVEAIDINSEAIAAAGDREERIRGALRRRQVPLGPPVTFLVRGLDTIQVEPVYDLVAFNTPAFYPTADLKNHPTPASQGAFVDDGDLERPERSFVYRFFRNVVLAGLRPGGHVVMSWPSLEKRLVHSRTAGRASDVVSPLAQLESWFGISIIGDKAPEAVYNRVAKVDFSYGLHDAFWRSVTEARDQGRFSTLVDVRSLEARELRFRFGVLHLVRSRSTPSEFNFIQEFDEV